MKIILSFFLLFNCAGCFLLAQPIGIVLPEKNVAFIRGKMDSLEWFFKSGKARVSKNICNISGHQDFYMDSTNFYFSDEAKNLAGEKKEGLIRLYALHDIALNFYNAKDYQQSTKYWQAALTIALSNDLHYEELHRMRPSLNNNFFLAGEYTNAMKISSDGLATAARIRDTNRIIHFTNVIGFIHMKQKNFAQAKQYFTLQLQLSKAIRDSLAEAHALYNFADLSVGQQQYDEAISFLQQSAKVYQSAISANLFTPKEREAFVFNKMAESYKLKGDLYEALRYSLHAVILASNGTVAFNKYDIAGYYVNAGDIYNRLNKTDSAIILLKKGIEISRQIIHREYTRDAAEQLAIAFAEMQMYDSAYTYHLLYSKLKDSIDTESNQQEILQREAYLKIEQEKQLQKAALEKQKLLKNIIIATALFALITLGFLYNRYRLRQKNRYQQQLNRQQNELFNAIADTQDKERKRIAEDIHDSLGSILSAAKLKLSALKESQPGMPINQLEKYQVAMQLLDEASAELRNISHNIMPASLSKLGLVAALKNLINNISSNSDIQISFSSHDFENRIAEQTEMSIYRIVLELINNIVKHAHAIKATVQLIRYPSYINISVEDNGCGFKYENRVSNTKGIGLGNILSRVEYLKGKMNVDAVPGRGTTIIIDIPYPQPS